MSGIAPARITEKPLHAAVALLAVSALGTLAPAGSAAGARLSGSIVTSPRPREVALLSPAGRGRILRRIHGGEIVSTAASADGGRIAFVVKRDRRASIANPDVLIIAEELWLMREDGSDAHRILRFIRRRAHGQGIIYPPAGAPAREPIESLDVSANGSKLLLDRYHTIYTLDADGQHMRRVPTVGARPQGFIGSGCCGARFAPDGRIVGHFESAKREGIATVPVGGGRVRFLRSAGFGAAFSPDGQRVAFLAEVEGADGKVHGDALWLMHSDGTGAHRVFFSNRLDLANPDFSPDGRRLAFNAYVQPRGPIDIGKTRSDTYVIREDGRHLRRVGGGVAGFHYPSPRWTR